MQLMEKNPAPLGMPQKVLIVRKNARRMHPQKFLKFCFPQESLCLYLEEHPPATLVRTVRDFTWQSETLCNERIGKVLASEKVLDEAS